MTNKEKLREAKKVLLKNGYSFIKNSNKYSVPEATQESISEAYNYLNEAAAIDFSKKRLSRLKMHSSQLSLVVISPEQKKQKQKQRNYSQKLSLVA